MTQKPPRKDIFGRTDTPPITDESRQAADVDSAAEPQNKENGEMTEATARSADSQRAAMDEISRLIKSVKQGRLTERADAGLATGDFKEVLSNINELLDAILLPIGEGNRILDQVADGKLDELIS